MVHHDPAPSLSRGDRSIIARRFNAGKNGTKDSPVPKGRLTGREPAQLHRENLDRPFGTDRPFVAAHAELKRRAILATSLRD